MLKANYENTRDAIQEALRDGLTVVIAEKNDEKFVVAIMQGSEVNYCTQHGLNLMWSEHISSEEDEENTTKEDAEYVLDRLIECGLELCE